MLSNTHEALVSAHETLSDQYRTLVTEYENLTNKEKNLQEKKIHKFVFSHPLLTKVYMKFRPFIKKFILPHFESPKTANSVAPKGFKVPEWGYVPQAEFEEKTDQWH